MMRLSRPCYDKMHRCPGWAGGGFRFARRTRCVNGMLDGAADGTLYDGWSWRLRFNRHRACGVIVLPSVVRWLDWTWWRWWAPFRVRNWWFDRRRRAR